MEYSTAVDLGSATMIKDMKFALVFHAQEKAEIYQVFEQYSESLKSYGSPWQIQRFNSMDSAKNWIETK